jgi:RNA polymerase sigma-70 factor (ECF subfamily)
MESQLALTLKTLCGFSIAEIAAAFLTTESTVNKRLYRAKEKIRQERVQFTVPTGQSLLTRLDAVLLVIYLVFNEGYNSSGDNPVIRHDLCLEAIRLAMLLTEKPVTNEYPPLYALLALLCLHSARFEARLDVHNSLIVLEEQDRGIWNQQLITRGLQFLSKSADGNSVTAYHLEAAIAAEHCLSSDFESTNWNKIFDYYIALERLKPSSVIKLNLAIVTAKKEGPWAAIGLLHELEKHRALDSYYLLYAALGEFYQQVGQAPKAQAYFRQALSMTKSAAIREVLEKKMKR